MNDSPIQVLLVEPDAAQAAHVRDVLSRDRAAAFQSVHVQCLGDALGQLRQCSVDVALLSLNLPDNAGLAAFNQIHLLAPDVPVIVLADEWDEALAVQAIQAGAQDCLARASLSPEPLSRAIRFAIGRQSRRADLRASERRFRALIENSADAIALVAADGTITYETASSQRVLGYAPSDVLGHRIQEFLRPGAQAATGELFGQVMRQPRQPVTAEFEYRRRDGSWCWVEVTANNLLDEPAVQAIVVNYRDISDRKLAQRTQQRFELLSAHSRDIILFIRRSDHRLLEANQAALAAYGYTREELLGLTIRDLRAPESRARLQAQLDQADGSDILFETVHCRKDGSTFPVEVNASGSELEGQRVLLSIVRDITERKQAQDALRQSEERLQAALRMADVGIFDNDHQADHLYWSPRLREIYGVGADEAVNLQTMIGFSHPPDRPSIEAAIQRANDPASNGLIAVEHRMIRRDGAVRWLLARWQTFFECQGAARRPVRTLGAVLDITERKQAQEALRQSEERLQAALRVADVGIFDINQWTDYIYWSPRLREIYGVGANEAVTRQTLIDLTDPRDGPSLEAAIRRAYDPASEGLMAIEYRIVRHDGAVRWLSSRWQMLFEGEGAARRPMRTVGAVLDITERMHAEADLRDGQARLDGIIASAMDAIITLDDDQRIVVFNTAAEQVFGCPAAEALGQPMDRFIPTSLVEAHRTHMERFAHSGTTSRAKGRLETLRARRCDGQEFPMEASISQTLVAGKRFFTVILRDVTERRRRQHELESIAAVSAALRTAPTRAEMLPVILSQVLDLLEASATELDVLDPAAGEVTIEAALGGWAPQVGRRIPAGQAVVENVLASGQPYISADVQTDPKLVLTEHMSGLRTAACVPLMADGQAIAGLWVGRQAPFTADEIRLLTAIADIAANAIHRAALHEQTAHRLRQLTALREIDQAINSSMGLPIVLSVVMEQVMALLRPDAADILLLNSAASTLDYAAGRGLRYEVASLPLGQGYASQAVLQRRMVRRPELSAEAAVGPEAGLPPREGFRAYYGVPLTAKGAVVGVLEIFQRAPLHPQTDWFEFLEALAGQAAIAIDNARLFEHMQRSNFNLSLAYEATIEGWSRALDLRDKETEGHSRRVTAMALELAAAMGMQAEQMEHMRRGAILHDIGKMGVPDNILLKPGPLTPDEWVIMRLHPTFAYEMLSPITYLAQALDIPYCHHEKWDGTGYPRRLKGEAIPLAARIFAVVDVWDALRSDRPYRPAWPAEQVREYIRSLAGTHFDPHAVSAAMETGLLVNEPRQ